MNVAFLVIARGGSKGVKRKNVRPLGGVPLIAYKICSARKSKYCERVLVSTEDAEIQSISSLYGAECPFTRPLELAGDEVASIDVVIHAMEWLVQNDQKSYDAIMLLEPSSPFSIPSDYDRAIELMKKRSASLVVEMRKQTPNREFIGEMSSEGSISKICEQMKTLQSFRRQDVPDNFTMSGGFYLMDWKETMETRKIYHDVPRSYGILSSSTHPIEIDNEEDFHYAKFLLEEGIVSPNQFLK